MHHSDSNNADPCGVMTIHAHGTMAVVLIN